MNRSIAVTAWLLLASGASAADVSRLPQVRAAVPGVQIHPEPQIGLVSEEVLRAKLASYGIANVASIQRNGNDYAIIATVNGQLIQLKLAGMTSIVVDQSGAALALSTVRRDVLIQSRAEKTERATQLNVAPIPVNPDVIEVPAPKGQLENLIRPGPGVPSPEVLKPTTPKK